MQIIMMYQIIKTDNNQKEIDVIKNLNFRDLSKKLKYVDYLCMLITQVCSHELGRYDKSLLKIR